MDREKRLSGAALFARLHDLNQTDDPVAARPPVRLCNLILLECLRLGAEEFRMVAGDEQVANVETRIGDEWKPTMSLPIMLYPILVNRLKVMANLEAGKVPFQEGEMRVRDRTREFTLSIAVEVKGSFEDVRVRFPSAPS
ncbi:MAG TPA: hypothetical protein VGI83_09680 [Gemmatimonadales bacterium]|jgi:type II secretory ATPase GspE/PulE/Tfp pilus assembly ATPase PilB-like protein